MSKQSDAGVSLLLKALKDSDEGVRCKAASGLGSWGRKARKAEVELLKQAVTDSSERVRRECLDAAWEVGRSARRTMKAMHERLSKEGGCDSGMCDVIEKIGPHAASAVPFLVPALRSDSSDLRWAAASALKAIGPRARDAVQLLLEALRDPNGTVAGNAAAALAGIGPKITVPALLKALDDPNPKTREYAADALGAMGKDSQSAVKKLLRLMSSDPVEAVRGWAGIALGEIAGRKESVQTLMSSLESPNPNVRIRSSQALGNIGREARNAMAALSKLSEDKFEDVARAAKEALKRIAGWKP
jgi:HEAT repeat protein